MVISTFLILNKLTLLADVIMILETMGVKLYKGCLNVVFDSKGDSYEVPNYCINMPHKYILKDEYKVKDSTNIKDEVFKVKLS